MYRKNQPFFTKNFLKIHFCCPFDAMGSTMATYAGQNVGAGKLDRVSKGVKSTCLLGLGYSLIAALILGLFGGTIALFFVDAGETETNRRDRILQTHRNSHIAERAHASAVHAPFLLGNL